MSGINGLAQVSGVDTGVGEINILDEKRNEYLYFFSVQVNF